MKAIKRSKSVVHLNVASNEIGNEGMVSLMKGLKQNESVISLNMSTLDGVSRNRIGFTGMRELGSLLMTNKFLTILDISAIGLGNDGFDLICDTLLDETLTSLLSLKSQSNEINSIAVFEKLKTAISKS